MWFSKNHFPVQDKLAVISGASQGAGLEFAKTIAKRGGNVIIVSRSESKLQKAVKEIEQVKQNSSQTVSYIAADLAEYKQCERVFEEIGQVPDIVVCCVGSSVPKLFLDLTERELELGVKTNYESALYFSHVALKRIAQANDASSTSTQPQRHLVFFSSVVAYFTFIGYGQYSPLKAALKNLADVLKQEATIYNTKVACVFPGNFMSEGFVEEQKTKPEITKQIEGPSYPIPAEKCCDIIINQLDKGADNITTDTIGYILSCTSIRTAAGFDWLVQIFVSFILNLISPIAFLVINKQISDYFKQQKKINTPKKD